MERIAIAGLSLHETDVAGLERLVRPGEEEREGFLRELADGLGASEVVLIDTCNRLELVFARESGHLPGRRDLEGIGSLFGLAMDDPLRMRLWMRTGRHAAEHLFRVASSLESLVVGEDQILAQVREAAARSRALGLTGPLLDPLFENAVQLGKRVRNETELCRHPVSTVSVGMALLLERLGPRSAAPRIALVGAGRMGALVAKAAAARGLPLAALVNRTPEKARGLAEGMGAAVMDLATFRACAEPFDAIVSVTGAPGVVLDAETLARMAERAPSGGPLVVLDLAVPRDVEPAGHPRVQVIDMDALREQADENRALRERARAEVEGLIREKLDRLERRASETVVASRLAEVLDQASDLFEHELARLLSGRLACLGDDERRAVERWARTTFGRMAHVPIRAFKELAAESGKNGGADELEEPGEMTA